MIAFDRIISWLLANTLALGLLCVCAVPALSIPAGRAWTPVETMRLGVYGWLSPERIDRDASGQLLLLASAHGGLGETAGFRWAGSTWTIAWRLGYEIGFSFPVVSPPGTYHMIWKSLEGLGPNGDRSHLVMTRVVGDVVSPPDTIALVWGGTGSYAAAASLKRRWAMVGDLDTLRVSHALRLFYSDTVASWHEVPVQGSGDFGCAAASLDDTTALVVWSGIHEGANWGILRGTRWTPGAQELPFGLITYLPRFRPRPDGGLWLAGATQNEWITVTSFREGVWSAPESLRCMYKDHTAPEYSDAIDLSQDPGQYPAAAWSAANGNTGIETVCAAVPSDSGFGVADDVSNSDDGLLPVIAKDTNGDVWVAWWKYFDGMFWTHTYTTAIASTPQIIGAGPHRKLTWTLSELAAETWWAVLRSVNGGPFESVARVRASSALEMSWTDVPPTANLLAYKIRRECVDTRYAWESAAVTLGAGARPPIYLGPPINLPGDPGEGPEQTGVPEDRRWNRLRLSLNGAEAGPLAAKVYDLQGREVMQRSSKARGGQEPFELDLAEARRRLPTGIYFLRVSDATGRASNAVRFVILR